MSIITRRASSGWQAISEPRSQVIDRRSTAGSGWDGFVPTNYTITTYVEEGIIDPLDMSKLPNYDAASFDPRFAGPGTVDGKMYAASKDWGTTKAEFSGRTTVHDYQLTTIGNVLKSF